MFKTYIDNYNSKENQEYLDLIPTIYGYKEKLLDNKKEEYFYRETEKEYHVKYKKFEVKITKPEYQLIETKLNELNNEKIKLLFDYNNLKYRIINEINSESDFDKYSKVVDRLVKIDDTLDNLHEYYKKVNIKNITNHSKNEDKLKNINEKIDELNIKFKNDIFKDDIEKRKAIDIYKKLLDEKKDIRKNYYNEVNYILLKKPVIKYITKEKIEKIEKKPKKSKSMPKGNEEQMKRYKLKQKIKEKNAKNQKNGEDIEDTIKKLEKKIKKQFFAEFNFKNEEECGSGSHSSDYFTKKPQILKVINKYPDIKKLMPKGYNKLSKADICKELYKL